MGCAGGDEYGAWEYFRDQGIHTEADYPYISGTDMLTRECRTDVVG